ncbi:hypothetical protein HZB02_06615 [Candidatus Woesearchaeota archaeon]|nr:hypothetical protein [Candidatus Woesearchaeota archaeon]
MSRTLDLIVRTCKQSPDATIFLASSVIAYAADYDAVAGFTAAMALKQYVWGYKSYMQTRKYIKRYLERGQEVNETAIKRVFTLCDYCGSRYALREYHQSELHVK